MDTLFGSVSNPVTLCPASANRSASGRPTYPQPMIATLSWAPLKNSGFRSIGMSCVALLVILDPCGVKRFAFLGIQLHLWPLWFVTALRSTKQPAGHKADVTKTNKYSRFRANKKIRAFVSVTALLRRVAAQGGTEEDRRAVSVDRGHTRNAARYDDPHYSSAGTCWWRASWPPGHRRRRFAGAGNGLPVTHGPAHGTRHFAFHVVAADWAGGLAGILEAGPGGFEGRYLVRLGDAVWRVRGQSHRSSNAFPQLKGLVRLFPHVVGLVALEKSATRKQASQMGRGERPWLMG